LRLTCHFLISSSGGGDIGRRVGTVTWLAGGVARPVTVGAEGLGLMFSTIKDPEKARGMSSDA